MVKIKFGVRVPNLIKGYFPLNTTLDFKTIKNYTLECETLGYDSVWVNDHLIMGEKNLEGWTLLSALSSVTEKIRLGTLVLANSFRYPSHLAKMVATLDCISNGRLEFGIGAGAIEQEHRAYGIPFPQPGERLKRLGEALEIVTRLWTEEQPSFKGEYYTIREAVCEPKPTQKPHPPILVGSSGKIALKLVARYADKCNFSHKSPKKYKELLSILEKYCRQIGRKFDEIEKSLWCQVVISEDNKQLKLIYNLREPHEPFEKWSKKMVENGIIGSPEECIEKLQEYEKLGVSLVIMRFEDAPDLKGINRFAKEVAPVFQ